MKKKAVENDHKCCQFETHLNDFQVLKKSVKEIRRLSKTQVQAFNDHSDHLDTLNNTLSNINVSLNHGFDLGLRGMKLVRFVIWVFLAVVAIQGVMILSLAQMDIDITSSGFKASSNKQGAR